MGREIEIKIPLTSKEFDMLYDFYASRDLLMELKFLGMIKLPAKEDFF